MGKIAEAYVDITGRLNKLDAALGQARGRLASFAGSLGTIGVAVGAGALGAGLLDAAKSAADLNETLSKTKVVFGDSSGAVIAQADDLADRFGLVRQVTLDAASNLGLVTQASGLTERASAQLSMQLTKLAADASSFFNVPFADALEKIRAGLVGESEPIRSFGVLLSEAAVQQQALSSGLVKSTKDIDDQVKVMARAQLIIQGLGKTSGDLERTAGSAANQMKKLAGDIENLKSDFGASLTGPLTDAIKLARELGAALQAAVGQTKGEGLGNVLGGAIRGVTNVVEAGRKGGFFAGLKEAFLPDQDAADRAAGVEKFDVGKARDADRRRAADARQAQLAEFAAQRAASDRRAAEAQQQRLWDRFGKPGMDSLRGNTDPGLFAKADTMAAAVAGGLAGGNPFGMLAALTGGQKGRLDAQARADDERERKARGFGGGFGGVTTGEDFWRDAQAKIAGKDTAEKQLEEQKRQVKAAEEAVGLLGELVKAGGQKSVAVARGRS